MEMGRILAFSIDLLRRFYNTLALPCECVMSFSTAPTARRMQVHYNRSRLTKAIKNKTTGKNSGKQSEINNYLHYRIFIFPVVFYVTL